MTIKKKHNLQTICADISMHLAGSFEDARWKQINGWILRLLIRGLGIRSMGALWFKVEASNWRENSLKPEALAFIASTMRCYILGGGSVSEKESNSKTVVVGLPFVPSLLGYLYSHVTFSTIKWVHIWCRYFIGKHQ